MRINKSYKVPGGKLIRLKATLKENRLLNVQLSGDFFLIPSEKITVLEEAMEGFNISEPQELKEVLDYVIEQERIRIQGFTTQDLINLLKQ